MRRIALWCLLLVCMLVGSALVGAQDELLQNSSLEEGGSGPYTTRRGGEFPIYLPNGWNAWLAAQSGDFYYRGDRTTINPHPGPGPSPQNGSRAVNVDCGFVTCTVAIYQQVPVQEDANIQASAFAQVKACNIAPDADNCGSAVESGSQTRIGIDPNGGTDPNDNDVVWSNWAQPHDQWLQMTVSATTTGTTATLFLYSTQANTAHLNRTYWDSASLKGGGAGGAAASANTPVPTAPPEVPFVVPQNAREDGSIVHIVSSGDTIDSIAVAYGKTRSDILELNPSIGDPRLIRLGQEIVIATPPPARPTADSAAEDEDLPTSGINLEDEVPDDPALTEEPDAEGANVETAIDEGDNPDDNGNEAVVVADAGEPQPTATTSPVTLTPAPVVADALPASDPSARSAAVCVLLFNDNNQNRLQEPNETLLAGGTVILTNMADSSTIGEVATDGVSEPHCFEDLAAGAYVAAAQPPADYGLTSPDQFRVQAAAGTRLDVAFGAAEGVVVVTPLPADGGITSDVTTQDATAPTSPLNDLFNISGLVVFGLAGFILIAGVGLTLFMRRR